MQRIGIVGAMDEEIEILRKIVNVENTLKIANMEFIEGKLKNKKVILVRCGIGKVNAASCAQILITQFKVDSIINTGVAGAIHGDLEIGDLVISDDVVQHDFDATGFGYKLGQIPRLDEYIFKSDKKLIEIAEKGCKENTDNKVYVGRILSGDIFISSSELKDKLWNEFEGYCGEMEGAAIGQVCYLNNIPFVILRAMSDKADGSAHINFNEFVHESSKTSAKIVEKMLELM